MAQTGLIHRSRLIHGQGTTRRAPGNPARMNKIAPLVQQIPGTTAAVRVPRSQHVPDSGIQATGPAGYVRSPVYRLPSEALNATICGPLDAADSVGRPTDVLNRFTQEFS